jgi:hypothetical protein
LIHDKANFLTAIAAEALTGRYPGAQFPYRLARLEVQLILRRHECDQNFFWGQVLAAGAVMLVFLLAATEWTAWRLGFQPQLGSPWFATFGLPTYSPLSFFWWWFAYDA